MRGTTCMEITPSYLPRISTHVPHAGHDEAQIQKRYLNENFNSRAPCGARLCPSSFSVLTDAFQLTCPMRGTTPSSQLDTITLRISTHVPLRGTTFASCVFRALWRISTHVPHAGHDSEQGPSRVRCNISTHVPHAGHDRHRGSALISRHHFNSRAPCGARQTSCGQKWSTYTFQLTCPMRGTTDLQALAAILAYISTHVPHAGHDPWNWDINPRKMNFNSRAPCGARHSRSRSARRSF